VIADIPLQRALTMTVATLQVLQPVEAIEVVTLAGHGASMSWLGPGELE
jgi:hypothetical protein